MATDFWTLLDLIGKNHPDIAALLSQPGVFSVAMDIVNAEANGTPWTNEQITAAMQATPWYQSTPSGVRDYTILRATDPATAQQKASEMQFKLNNLQNELGIQLDTSGGFGSQSFQFFTQAVTQGWDDTELRARLVAAAHSGNMTNSGMVGDTMVQLRKDANDYGVPVADNTLFQWAGQIAGGTGDKSGFDDWLIGQASSLYPALNNEIQRGITVRQAVDPYLQIAHQELGVDPSTADLLDPKWNSAINQVDPKTGQRNMMSLADWTAKVRSDPTYGYDQTTQATTQAAAFAKQLASQFGATG